MQLWKFFKYQKASKCVSKIKNSKKCNTPFAISVVTQAAKWSLLILALIDNLPDVRFNRGPIEKLNLFAED